MKYNSLPQVLTAPGLGGLSSGDPSRWRWEVLPRARSGPGPWTRSRRTRRWRRRRSHPCTRCWPPTRPSAPGRWTWRRGRWWAWSRSGVPAGGTSGWSPPLTLRAGLPALTSSYCLRSQKLWGGNNQSPISLIIIDYYHIKLNYQFQCPKLCSENVDIYLQIKLFILFNIDGQSSPTSQWTENAETRFCMRLLTETVIMIITGTQSWWVARS